MAPVIAVAFGFVSSPMCCWNDGCVSVVAMLAAAYPYAAELMVMNPITATL